MSRVLQFHSENIKRVEVLDITPTADIVEIAGKNKQGKTSAIQCLSMAIEGARHIQKVPIREGAETGQIKLTLGTKGKDGKPDTVEMIVHREFSRREATKTDAKLFATKLTLTLADGQEPKKAQDILNGLYNSICTDPLAFTRMKPNEQYDALRKLVPGFDFEAHDNKQRADFTRRADINRDAEKARASASLITFPTNTPDEPIDEKAITDAMATAGATNGEIEARKVRRDQVAQEIERLGISAANAKDRIPEIERAAKEDADHALTEYQRTRAAAAAKMVADVAALETSIAEDLKAAAALQEKLDKAPALPEPVDTAALTAQLAAAQATNTHINNKIRKATLTKEATEFEAEAKALTDRREAREAEKNAAIKAAKLPVEGLSFGEGEILLNGLPFEQASFREQLVASCAIAMSSDPKIRIMHIADGNAIDEEGLEVLKQIAKDNDFQVWLESVSPQTDTAIIIENGKEKGK